MQYYTIATEIGTAAASNAFLTGTKVNITTFIVGDGGGIEYAPTPDMTELRSEVWRGVVSHAEIDPDSPNVINYTALLPSTVGGFVMREMGIVDDQGRLIGIGNMASTPKIRFDQGISDEIELTFSLTISSPEAMEWKVDPTVILATKADVKKHNDDPAAHNNCFLSLETQLKGISIQLYVSLSGSDETGDGTQDKPYRTVQKAVDAIKPYHTDASIIIGAGDYDEAVNIRNKLATIMISSKAPENRARLKSLNAYYCRHIWLDSLNFDGTDLGADSACISAMCVGNMQMHDCEIAGSAAAFGVSSNGSSVFVMDTSISNCGVAILTTYNSLLTARVISGDNNKIGCSVHSSILNISNSTLQAATLTEKRGGGIIYKEGVQV